MNKCYHLQPVYARGILHVILQGEPCDSYDIMGSHTTQEMVRARSYGGQEARMYQAMKIHEHTGRAFIGQNEPSMIHDVPWGDHHGRILICYDEP